MSNVFSEEFCELLQNIYFLEWSRTTVFGEAYLNFRLKRDKVAPYLVDKTDVWLLSQKPFSKEVTYLD